MGPRGRRDAFGVGGDEQNAETMPDGPTMRHFRPKKHFYIYSLLLIDLRPLWLGLRRWIW